MFLIMKIIVKESKIDMLMTDYLNSWLSSKNMYKRDSFIIIDSYLDDGEDGTVMEYDSWDGRLWFMKYFRKTLMDLFNKSESEVNEVVKKWFEHKFNVKIKFVE